MKKIVSILILTVVILAGTTRVFGERFEGLGMNIDLPEEYYNLKAGVDTNDSKVEFYTALMQTTKEDLAAEYKQNLVLYNGISSNLANEIYISETENNLTKSIFHLSLASEDRIDKVENEIKKVNESQGLQITSQETYSNNGIKFIKTVSTKSKLTIYQYYTIINGTGITISLHSSDSSAKIEDLKKIIDTISFEELQEKPADITLYVLIGITAILVIMVLVLMYMAFFSKRNEDDYEETDNDNN